MQFKTLLALTAGLTLYAATASAQFFRSDNTQAVALIKSQPLVVLLEEEDPKELKKLAATPTELTQYKAYIALHNRQLQELVPKLWQLSGSVEFKPASELEALRKAKEAKTVVLYRLQQKVSHYDNGHVNDRFNKTYLGSSTEASVRLGVEGDGKEDTYFFAPSPLNTMTASDIFFAVRYLQDAVRSEMAGRHTFSEARAAALARTKANGLRLRTKTLLIDKASVSDKLTPAIIQKTYPYPYQLVSRQEIEAAALASDARYIYARQLSTGVGLIDAADSRLLGISATSGELDKSNFKIFKYFAELGM